VSRTIALNGSAQVTLDSNGNGQAQAGPRLPGVSWAITGVAVSVATNINEALCSVYSAAAGPFTPGPQDLLGATATGSTGDTLGPQITIWPGQVLAAVWQGGDPGQVATMSYWGTAETP
jgi:hypothetical protein